MKSKLKVHSILMFTLIQSYTLFYSKVVQMAALYTHIAA